MPTPLIPLLALTLLPQIPGAAAREPSAEVPSPAGLALLDHGALAERLRALAAAHPDTVQLARLGRSREGREILAVRLSDGDPPHGRPAILVVANLGGPQVFTSALALWQAQQLAERHAAGDEAARALLSRASVFILPRANPDGAEARFQRPLRERFATGPGLDEDRDGREGEDAPEDLDGDGVIATLRVGDPRGEWMEDPADARALVRADPRKGERGRWRLWPEGRDRDGDERIAEDPPQGARVDRNFPHGWREHSVEGGRFPLDEPEARALADFVILHREIALVLTYGDLDNLVEKPRSVKEDAPAVKRVPQPGILEGDARLLEELGRRYAKACGATFKGHGEAGGSFQEWVYQHRGLLSLAVCPWDIPLDGKPGKARDKGNAEAEKAEGAGEEGAPGKPGDGEPREKPDKPDKPKATAEAPKPGDDAKRLAWIDASGEEGRFLPWRRFQHPELGEVEIGGLAPYARLEPPAAEQEGIARDQLDFLLGLADALPRLEIARFEARPLAAGLLQLDAVVTCDGLVPQRTAAGRRTRAVRPARVRLELPAGAELLAGQPLVLVGDLEGMGGAGARRELRWLVRGAAPEDLVLELDSDNAGAVRRNAEATR